MSFLLSLGMDIYKKLKEDIDSLGGLDSFKASMNRENPWNKAFDLYNRQAQRRLRKGCDSCRRTVYNWIASNVKEEPVIDDLFIEEKDFRSDLTDDQVKDLWKQKTGRKRVGKDITIDQMLKDIEDNE